MPRFSASFEGSSSSASSGKKKSGDGEPPSLASRYPLVAALKETKQEEEARLKDFAENDPIALQDTMMTCEALVAAAKGDDAEGFERVIEESTVGEFTAAAILKSVGFVMEHLNVRMVKALVSHGVPLHHHRLPHMLSDVCRHVNPQSFGRAVEILSFAVKEQGMPLDSKHPSDGYSALCVACQRGLPPLCRVLLDMGANPNLETKWGLTPLLIIRRALRDLHKAAEAEKKTQKEKEKEAESKVKKQVQRDIEEWKKSVKEEKETKEQEKPTKSPDSPNDNPLFLISSHPTTAGSEDMPINEPPPHKEENPTKTNTDASPTQPSPDSTQPHAPAPSVRPLTTGLSLKALTVVGGRRSPSETRTRLWGALSSDPVPPMPSFPFSIDRPQKPPVTSVSAGIGSDPQDAAATENQRTAASSASGSKRPPAYPKEEKQGTAAEGEAGNHAGRQGEGDGKKEEESEEAVIPTDEEGSPLYGFGFGREEDFLLIRNMLKAFGASEEGIPPASWTSFA
uniref:Uncharacterized protein n=1 Tax=Chromera velia CCMP2878 TaxID=1169474 RepID=A0A0G4G037_9ALVE|mmetsp:Transcript_2644/g.5462  ORF Transcript_2644/g.5462 Transcript_2644/m.5462 type:complete len:511 (+) Transcript_2644:57-1589(+)|eukprot:Cvel_19553.t1-p1 / transcript=Cvel_19553.t1 / gene=Cvel_19553 / organism=Chromera_velia_CCMP2878 / gene_product=hypothetical protein / transcript_product=hypothetical protein / location=Cvel_scaffold1694:35071-38869(-) / protein_length=510 / sequence_SO=supercontig / SO=protein_coding / is_pseudo=false